LGLGRFYRRIVGRDGRLQLIELGLLLLDILARNDIPQAQCREPIQVLVSRNEERRILRFLCFCLIQSGHKQTGLDACKDIALFDVLALGEKHGFQYALDLGMDRNRLRGLNGAEAGQVNRDVFPHDSGDADWNGKSARSRLAGIGLLRVPKNRAANAQNKKSAE
jgi:hypothetical protein